MIVSAHGLYEREKMGNVPAKRAALHRLSRPTREGDKLVTVGVLDLL